MKGTKTSSFGTKGRVAHDSSKFYNSKLYKEIKNNNSDIIVNEFPNELLNTIIEGSCENMKDIPNNSSILYKNGIKEDYSAENIILFNGDKR